MFHFLWLLHSWFLMSMVLLLYAAVVNFFFIYISSKTLFHVVALLIFLQLKFSFRPIFLSFPLFSFIDPLIFLLASFRHCVLQICVKY